MVKYTIHGGWGNHIEWLDAEKLKVWGHMPRIPEKGDYLFAPMQSGRTGVFSFKKVERTPSVVDMFFAEVVDVGYEDKIDLPPLEEQGTGMHPGAHVMGD